MADIVEYTYNNYNNSIDLLLKADGAAVNLDSVTTMELHDVDGAWDITDDSAFDRSTGTTGKVIISLGDQGLAAGRYRVRLIVKDPTNTDGLVWGDAGFVLHVR